jgi:hypothetical protein
MEKTFRPQRSFTTVIILTSYGLTLLMSGILIFSGNSIENLLTPFLIFFCLGSIFPVLALSTRVKIQNGVLSATTFPLFTRAVKISDISKITYLSNYAGMGKGIEVHSQMNNVRVGIGAFGVEQTKEIIRAIMHENRGISLDDQVEKMLT